MGHKSIEFSKIISQFTKILLDKWEFYEKILSEVIIMKKGSVMNEKGEMKFEVEFFVPETNEEKKSLIKWIRKNIKKKMYLFDVYKMNEDALMTVFDAVQNKVYYVLNEMETNEKDEPNFALFFLKEVASSLMHDVPEYFELFTDKKILKSVLITIVKKLMKKGTDNWIFFKVKLLDPDIVGASVEYGCIKFDDSVKLTPEVLELFKK